MEATPTKKSTKCEPSEGGDLKVWLERHVVIAHRILQYIYQP
jgi:hypothetical protein